MPLEFIWTGNNELDRVAAIRWQCYSSRGGDLPAMIRRTAVGRHRQGDVCIASRDGRDVATATSFSLAMYVRGREIACQGVGWVGTSKPHRKRRPGEKGAASQVMGQLLNMARERGELVSALMPFRASFYEHFGYGVVERQNRWTIPVRIADDSAAGNWRFGSREDKSAMVACRARQSAAGHCDIGTSPAAMEEWFAGFEEDTQLFVDERDGVIHAYTWIRSAVENDRQVGRAVQPAWDSSDSFRSLLGLLATLKDQYALAIIHLPVDLPLHWLLKERQIPHRPVDHPAAGCQTISRMQARILDHVGFLQGQTIARAVSGAVVVCVKECEGGTSVLEIDLGQGIIEARASSRTPDVTLSDVTWAAIACGELRATHAWRAGLIDAQNQQVLPILDVLSEGPAPFAFEFF